ncbi:MAG: hypothetical protein A3D93_04995 [Acidobacteria bacterium RIFCSPHIGHO2_12_FULL_67_30]|nr:MAG: hypothetical protein A2620_05610 [Acidobacteria bacterium RIFCSPHIGHO2_01_FULL_67_28]OFV85265.1 MAG: hypothetical protein A3B65_00115 [Acidobacteria bacterium RIFCSPHIGHO2_02_FULL_67_57]OFV88747.1 MAG: hypothetical protein A3D93_04995 [Acidobacteria bacterium RIFCSPHIGHO2_12_FULL_67_30]
MIKDYYYLLGLPRGAPLSDIKQAYRKLAAQYHPDKVAGMSPEVQQEATARMMELNEAIAIFTDPDQRAVYDENVELIPERKPGAPPPWAGKPRAEAPRPAPPPPPKPASEAPAAAPKVETPPPARPAAAPPPPPPRPSPPPAAPTASEPTPAPATPPRGMLAEEYVRKLRGTLKKLPLNWKDAELRGWSWALEGGGWRRSIVVAHRHMETLSLLSFRGLQSAVQALVDAHKIALRPTAIFVLVSYERLMDAKAVQEQLPALGATAGGWLKNVRAALVLYDGQRASLIGSPGDDAEVQRVARVLMGR